MNIRAQPEGGLLATQGIEGVVALLADPRGFQRAEAIQELAAAPLAVASAALEALVNVDNLEARSATLEILRGRPENEERLQGIWQRLAAAAERDARAQALETAARLSKQRAAELLPLWVKDTDLVLRRRALNRLMLTGQKSAARRAMVCTLRSARRTGSGNNSDGFMVGIAPRDGCLDSPRALANLRQPWKKAMDHTRGSV